MTDRRLRILDLTDPLGHQAARIFVGLGADVVRVVAPDESTREADRLHWHAGKRLLTPPETDSYDTFLADLAAQADVVLESGTTSRLHTLSSRAAHPRAWTSVIHTVITPFGLSGPHRHWTADDTVLTAAGGMAWLCGDPGRAPEPPPRGQGLQLAGTHGAIGALLALIARQRTGTGQLVEVSGQEAVAATLEVGAVAWIHGKQIPKRNSGIYGHVAHQVFRAADGFLAGGYSGSPGCGMTSWPGWSPRTKPKTSQRHVGRTPESAGTEGHTSTPWWLDSRLAGRRNRSPKKPAEGPSLGEGRHPTGPA